MLYIDDHNGNKFYLKLYCVILDKLSAFTTFLSNILYRMEVNVHQSDLATNVLVNKLYISQKMISHKGFK